MAPSRIESVFLKSSDKISKPVVYFLDDFHPDAVSHAQRYFDVVLRSDSRHSQWRENAEYLLIKSSYLDAYDIARCPNLKAIGKQGVGIDNLDEAVCKERGVKIFNTPGVNAQAVAETVLTLTMSVAREVGRITASQNEGKMEPKERCSSLIISQKTIGIVGMGNIGQQVAQIFGGGLGCAVVAYDPLLPDNAWADIPHMRARTLKSLLQACDVVTLHIPLLPETRYLIAYPEFRFMKRNAILIDAARGGIINESDLERALNEGLIWGAGPDCHEQEPPTKQKYGDLWGTGKVVSTPHIGAATSQTQMETAIAAIDRLRDYFQLSCIVPL